MGKWGSLLNGMGHSGWSLYDSFNQNMEYLGSVGPTPLFMMPPPSPIPFTPPPEKSRFR